MKFTFVGIFVGAFIGFLLRPAVPLVGQLPFLHCITAGATLEGLDQMLVPTARTSFSYMLAGAVVGGFAGYFACRQTGKQ